MLPRELLRQVHRLQLRARRAVEDLLGGEYRSIFKGPGLAFEEVREYQAGDDIRAIDWNVTARMGHPFVKRFVEEREQTIVLLVDASASMLFGTQAKPKRDVVAELAAVLACAAAANKDRTGLILFTDRVERFLPPRRGSRHVLRLIRDVLFFQPKRRGTNLAEALRVLDRVQHRRAIVFLLSDFTDRAADRMLRIAGRRHDLIALAIRDPREEALPPAGLLAVEDPETGQTAWLDTGRRAMRDRFAERQQANAASLEKLARSAQIDFVPINTDGGHLEALARFFRLRQLRLRQA